VSQASTAEEAMIIQWTCVGSPNETWALQSAASPPPPPGPPAPAASIGTARRSVAPGPGVQNGGSFIAPITGTLYLKCVGGSAGALSQFGLGTSPSTFVSYLSALPGSCPTAEVAAGGVMAGQAVPFGIQTWWTGRSYWAFSTGADPGSIVSFTDMNNRLGWGGSILQSMGTNTWVLHLNDAAHYTLDYGEADNILIQIRLQPAESSLISVFGPPPPPPVRSSAADSLGAVRDALHRAVNALERAANQSCPVKKTIADIRAADGDLDGATAFVIREPGGEVPPSPSSRPSFIPPPRPAPLRNVMLEDALNDLKTAFDTLARSDGGDLGGYRARVNADIATASSDLIAAMNAANAAFLDGHRELPPCSSAR
jgi:prepilin-type processing-associated H-X9-DG protein